MEIKEYTSYNEEEILELYSKVDWTAYTKDPISLRNGFVNSLLILGAYVDNKLVGLIRIIGDKSTIIYVQDLLVSPQYQRRGIGKALIEEALSRYKNVRQIVLISDSNEGAKAFYEREGFKELKEYGCISFMKANYYNHKI